MGGEHENELPDVTAWEEDSRHQHIRSTRVFHNPIAAGPDAPAGFTASRRCGREVRGRTLLVKSARGGLLAGGVSTEVGVRTRVKQSRK